MSYRYTKKYFKIYWLIVFHIISPLLFHAQNQRYSIHQLTTDDGLSQASNDFIYKDSKGFVWLSSIDGLNRFDGKKVRVYKSISGDSTSLIGNIITSNFFEDERSNLWFTTNGGIHQYIRDNDHFQSFQIKNEKGESLTNDYYAFHLEENQLWLRIGVDTQNVVHLFDIYDLDSKTLSNISGQRNYTLKNENGEITKLISSYFVNKKGIEVMDITSTKTVSYFRNKQSHLPRTLVFQVHIISPNEWYLATDIGLILFHEPSQKFELYDHFYGMPIGNVSSSASINDSILLVATQKQSVLLFHKKKRRFIRRVPYEIGKKIGLKLAQVNQIYKDPNDNIWLTSRSSGVHYGHIHKRKFELSENLLGRSIKNIFKSKKGEFFCSYNSSNPAYFNNRNADIFIPPVPVPERKKAEAIFYFLEDKGEIWAITNSYLLKWNRAYLRFDYVQELPNYVLTVFKDRASHVWLATYSGIYEWKSEGNKVVFDTATQFKTYQTTQATAIYEDVRKQKYLALDASKLVILDQNYNELKQIKGIGYAKDFYEEGRFLWIATTTGVLKINTHDLTIEILNEQNGGLPNETYYSIIPDEQNNFWLSSNKGIVRYNRNTKTYHRYTLADGLQGNEYNTNAFLKTQDGEIWMGGTNGLNRFYPEKIKSEIPLAKVQFTRLQINDEPAPDSINITMAEELSLAYSDNTLSFDFVGIDYSDPENVQLKYQMLGNDEDWIDAGNDGFARYSNLPFGNYTFQVKAANSDGVWSEEIKQLNIYIKRPWYRTWWFYLASILSISGLIYGIFTYRLQQALKIERMRVKISSDLHDDVGGLLSGLAMQSELLEMTAAEERKPKLQRISELSRNAMSRMRDTVWAIDARKDKLENLLDRIREHAAETLTPNDIAFDLKVDDLALDKNMPINIRQNLYLICKEAITNTAKHSNGNQVQIQFKKHGRNGIELTIHDNGEVLQKAHKTTGLGMSNMQMRTEEIGGQLEIITTTGFLIKIFI